MFHAARLQASKWMHDSPTGLQASMRTCVLTARLQVQALIPQTVLWANTASWDRPVTRRAPWWCSYRLTVPT